MYGTLQSFSVISGSLQYCAVHYYKEPCSRSLVLAAAAAAVARTGLTQAPGATGCSMVFAAFDGPSGHGCGDAAPSERINRKMRKMTSFIFRRAASVQKLFRHTFQPAGPLGDTAICPECPKLCYSKIWPQKTSSKKVIYIKIY